MMAALMFERQGRDLPTLNSYGSATGPQMQRHDLHKPSVFSIVEDDSRHGTVLNPC
jgi:hypothetical protein